VQSDLYGKAAKKRGQKATTKRRVGAPLKIGISRRAFYQKLRTYIIPKVKNVGKIPKNINDKNIKTVFEDNPTAIKQYLRSLETQSIPKIQPTTQALR
jgi:hypothetical protein